MLSALKRDYEATKNADFSVSWQFLNSDGVTPIDFSGCSAKLQLRDYEGQSGNPVLSLYNGNGITYGGLGTWNVVISKNTLANIAAGLSNQLPFNSDKRMLSYDFVITTAAGVSTRWIYGVFTLHSGVSY